MLPHVYSIIWLGFCFLWILFYSQEIHEDSQECFIFSEMLSISILTQQPTKVQQPQC